MKSRAPSDQRKKAKSLDERELDGSLSKAEIRMLNARLAEHRDTTRYVVGDPMFSRGHKKVRGFFYIIGDNMYGMLPTQGSPIKSLKIARAIQAELNRGPSKKARWRKGFLIYKCRITKNNGLKDFVLHR